MNENTKNFIASHKCEVCGKPPVCAVRDFKVRDDWRDVYRRYGVDGPVHWFCASHERESIMTTVYQIPPILPPR